MYAWKSGSDDDPWQAKFELARNETHGLRTPSVQTVDFTLIFTLVESVTDSYRDDTPLKFMLQHKKKNGEKKRFIATLDCGSSPWGRVREWLTNVEVRQKHSFHQI